MKDVIRIILFSIVGLVFAIQCDFSMAGLCMIIILLLEIIIDLETIIKK